MLIVALSVFDWSASRRVVARLWHVLDHVAISGGQPMKQALILIDVQESFRKRPYFRADGLASFIANVQSLIDRCRARGASDLVYEDCRAHAGDCDKKDCERYAVEADSS